jgi:hypothetical protein
MYIAYLSLSSPFLSLRVVRSAGILEGVVFVHGVWGLVVVVVVSEGVFGFDHLSLGLSPGFEILWAWLWQWLITQQGKQVWLHVICRELTRITTNRQT